MHQGRIFTWTFCLKCVSIEAAKWFCDFQFPYIWLISRELFAFGKPETHPGLPIGQFRMLLSGTLAQSRSPQTSSLLSSRALLWETQFSSNGFTHHFKTLLFSIVISDLNYISPCWQPISWVRTLTVS